MSKSITDQLLDKGIVKPEETPAAKRESVNAARPPEPEKELPPLGYSGSLELAAAIRVVPVAYPPRAVARSAIESTNGKTVSASSSNSS